MKNTNLFQAPDGTWISAAQILSLFEKVKAADAEVLFIHTGMTFGLPNPELGRQELLARLFEVIQALGVPTLCFPTFTFSFCNGEDYNVQTSRCKMGALNEYVRKLPGTIRSVDPLMSSILVGEKADLVQDLGKHSIGENSTFDKLHRLGKGVKFLFMGTSVSECYTYTHYVEERIGSPYRYHREFSGRITDGTREWQDTYTLFVRYQGVIPSSSGVLEQELLRRGMLRKESCGASSIACLGEADGYQTIVEQLEKDPYEYVVGDPEDRSREFAVQNMVAL